MYTPFLLPNWVHLARRPSFDAFARAVVTRGIFGVRHGRAQPSKSCVTTSRSLAAPIKAMRSAYMTPRRLVPTAQ